MITKDIRQNYTELFKQINTVFNYTDANEIQDINDFFMELENIKNAVEQKVQGADPMWLILPRDEGLFEIDANSRKINIPAEFSRNGVGVQGDELAEIIYFSIDRYFDTTDLYDKDIFVQWEAPNGDTGLSVTINKTLNYIPGKVVFGWPIVQEMTKAAGNIRFAVRFYARDESNKENPILLYSFGTLTSTIKINPALDFNITNPDIISTSIVDKNKQIYNNLRNSSAIGLDTPAAEPIFDTGNFNPSQDAEYDLGQIFQGRAKFDTTIDAAPASKGTISYSWRWTNRDETRQEELNDTPDYILLPEGTTLDVYDQFYTKEGANYVIYTGASPVPTGTSVYKRVATCTGNKAGHYYLKAINFAGRGNTKMVECPTAWKIAFAEIPTFKYTKKQAIIRDASTGVNISIEAQSNDNGKFKYQWKYSETEDGKYSDVSNAIDKALVVKQVGYYKLQAINTKNNDEATALSDAIRVTMPASEIKNIKFVVNGQNYNSGDTVRASKGTNITVIFDTLQNSDSVAYKWTLDGKEISSSDTCQISVAENYEVVIVNNYNSDIVTSATQSITVFLTE